MVGGAYLIYPKARQGSPGMGSRTFFPIWCEMVEQAGMNHPFHRNNHHRSVDCLKLYLLKCIHLMVSLISI